jgi:hypothetical protein
MAALTEGCIVQVQHSLHLHPNDARTALGEVFK